VPLPRLRDRRGPNRPFAVRLVSRLDTATADLKRLADTAPDEALTDENRAQLVERLTNLMFQVQNALTALGLVEDMEKRPG
jgi:hypothetical protein